MSEVRWNTDTAILVDANLQPNNMNIKVDLVDDGRINISVDDIYGVAGGYDFFEGPYEVTPETNPQELETKDKLMADNVVVFEIPYYETSNLSGGVTAIIGDK